MPFTPMQIAAAQAVQHAAAGDAKPQVRVVAGPGTGKSATIEERVRWLLAAGVPPTAIHAVSFTRASARDLRYRVHTYCSQHGQPSATSVRVTTLHSLALRTLRAANLLAAYPADPLVMDAWELETVFDAEFGHVYGIGKKRREQIRYEHEAFWSTGVWGPPNYIPPNPAITPVERSQFNTFHGPRTQTYACVVPGEIVRKCVTHIHAGTLDPAELLGLQHLIVDEYQDLNPMDLEFIDTMAAQGVVLFAAGDDDQSIYSFRFASPAGIQDFTTKYPAAGQHTLSACFRCTPTILAASQALITANSAPHRIPKTLSSLYTASAPPVPGTVHRWRFATARAEARAIGESCRDLIAAGVGPRDLLILLSNQRVLGTMIMEELTTAGVQYEAPRSEGFIDSEPGRLVLSVLRIVCDNNDYVAHRVLLGLRHGVGIGTANKVTEAVIASNSNYRQVFYQALPGGVFMGSALTALNHARALCAQFTSWAATDTLAMRTVALASMVTNGFGAQAGHDWAATIAHLPPDTLLEEVRDYLWADTDEQLNGLISAIHERLGLQAPTQALLPPRVRIMTMHGAKGLAAHVVFIPGLEDEILPGPWRNPYPGLVLEAARLLYVSLTRARVSCIASFARRRTVNGTSMLQTPSRFTTNLGGTFLARTAGLTAAEVQHIMQERAIL